MIRNRLKTNKHLCTICAEAVLLIFFFSHFSCSDDKEEFNWVDLRYKAEDVYNLSATNAEVIKIQVKSTDPWIVYSQHEKEKWCNIIPSTGDDPEQIYDVEIQYADNTELDDRIDTLIVQSDYWIGKWITVNQKGTAYLQFTPFESFMLPRKNGSYTFSVESNQNWTAEVTEGSEWLSIKDADHAEGNGNLTVVSTDNNGAMRTAVVTLFDRHHVAQATAECKQDGVQLEIDNELIKTDYQVKEHSITVHSNTKWTAVLENPQDLWIELSKTDFVNDDELKFNVRENDTHAPREGVIIARTSSEGGAVVVERRITVKQSHKPFAEHWEFTTENFPEGNGTTGWMMQGGAKLVDTNLEVNYIGSTSRIYKFGNPVGRYKLRILPMEDGSRTGFWFKAAYIEFRFHLNAATGKTEVSNNKKVGGMKNISFDPSKPHDIEFEYTKGGTVKGKVTSNLSLYLDGVRFTYLKNIDVPWKSPITLYIGSQKGTVVYDYMEFTAPVSIEDL